MGIADVSDFARGLVRDRAESLQTNTVLILRGGAGGLDRTTGLQGGMADAKVIYRGTAHIRAVNGNRTIQIGGDEVVQRDTIVSIPIEAELPRVDDLVILGATNPSDVTVNHLSLRVTGVDAGGRFGDARRLSCVGFGKNRGYGGA